MSKLIDISVRLHPEMPAWPDSAGLRVTRVKSIANGDEENASKIEMDVHCGTHVEGPLHFLDGGAALSSIPLDVFVGVAHVVHLPEVDAIGPEELAQVPTGVERLLLRTRNSEAWAGQTKFRQDYVGLTVEGAKWIADHGIRLVGIDYLSIQPWSGDPETHRILMRAGVAVLEGIDLSSVAPAVYRLICLPLRLQGTEASPVRAVLEAML